jgi:transaldolase
MQTNRLTRLRDFGQSVWMDYISRGVIKSGELKRLIDEDGLSGVTSNPTIFDKSIAGSNDYDETIAKLTREAKDATAIMWKLMIEDVRAAADAFYPVYQKFDGRDGFVSIEVSPHLAYDTKGTIEDAKRLWQEVDRPNIFIKVPGTPEGLPAIRQLISEAINVNITLLFGLPRYKKVADAYVSGLEDRIQAGKQIEHVASVASFFLSRIDTMVDLMLEAYAKKDPQAANELKGEAAIASAKIAYQIYKPFFGSARFKKLAEKGASSQRLLWASTSTKNPAYSDIKYVEPLIGRYTINTMPPETINAYRDHGEPALRIEEDVDKAYAVLEKLRKVGINILDVTEKLEKEGVEKFIKPFDSLEQTIRQKMEAVHAGASSENPKH